MILSGQTDAKSVVNVRKQRPHGPPTPKKDVAPNGWRQYRVRWVHSKVGKSSIKIMDFFFKKKMVKRQRTKKYSEQHKMTVVESTGGHVPLL